MRKIYLVYTLDENFKFRLLNSKKSSRPLSKYDPGVYHYQNDYDGSRLKIGVLGPYKNEETARAAIEFFYEISDSNEFPERNG